MKQVLIIGAGIAGPALAIALKRAGIESIVYEATDHPRDEAGVFLNVAPNGLSVLHALGLSPRLAGLGFQNDRLVFHNETGRLLAEVPVGGITVKRGSLSRLLREAAVDAGIRFEFGKTIASVTEHGGCVVAHFSNGTTVHGSALIGADGIHSRTRYSCFPEAPKPTYTGIVNLGGVVRTDLPSTGRAMHMIFGRRNFFGYAVRPDGETYWFSNLSQPQEPPRSAMVNGDYRDRLLAAHASDPPEVMRILQAVSGGSEDPAGRAVGGIGAWPDYDIPSLPAWHRETVCLLGDAAHALGPHVGQGSSLALEDAFVMAKCLRDIPQVSQAFATFEHVRRGRVEPIARQSRRTGRQKAPSGWLGRRMRDALLPVFLKSSARAANALYHYPLDWEARILCESSRSSP